MNSLNTVLEYFSYELDFSALAAGATATSSLNIEANSDFRWIKACYFADTAAGVQTSSTRVIPLATVHITDSGSGQQLMNNAAPISSLFGTGEVPFILPVSRIFTARSSIQVAVANFSAATAYNIRLSFIGAKIYHMGG